MREFIGGLSETIFLERRVVQASELGTQTGEWVAYARARAQIVPDGHSPESEGNALSYLARYRVTVRVRDDVEVGHRIRWTKCTMQVRQVLRDPRLPDRMTLRCEEERR